MKPWPNASALDALLSDSLVQLAMRADRVETRQLRAMFADVSRKIASRRAPELPSGLPPAPRMAIPAAMRRDASAFDAEALCGLSPCW